MVSTRRVPSAWAHRTPTAAGAPSKRGRSFEHAQMSVLPHCGSCGK